MIETSCINSDRSKPVTQSLNELLKEICNENQNQTIVDPSIFKQVLASSNKLVRFLFF